MNEWYTKEYQKLIAGWQRYLDDKHSTPEEIAKARAEIARIKKIMGDQ